MSNKPADTSSRRGLFKHLVKRTAKVAVSTVERTLPPERRPPFALPEAEFLATCTKSWDCVRACPHDAIHVVLPPAPLSANTPIMVPDESACLMCDGWPCAAACQSGALSLPVLSDDDDDDGESQLPTTVNLGTARLRTDLCFTFKGPECGACGNWCPDDAKALTFRAGRPHLDEDICVGCGACIVACVTTPKAIVLLPLSSTTGER